MRTWNFTDGHGNTSTNFVQTINVEDNTPPEFSDCPNNQTFCQSGDNMYNIPSPLATDNCSSVVVTYSISGATVVVDGSGSDASGIFNPGISTITWTATDDCGNFALCTTQVTVNQPTITATAGANGSIDPLGTITLACAGDQAFTFTPDPCYHVDQVLVDGQPDASAVTNGNDIYQCNQWSYNQCKFCYQ